MKLNSEILPGCSVRGFVPFDEAARKNPSTIVIVYNRVSSPSQKDRLPAIDQGVIDKVKTELQEHAPDWTGEIRKVTSGVEEGKRRKPRPAYRRAVAEAERLARYGRPVILVASDLDRFMRSNDFHRQENPKARPTLLDAILIRPCDTKVIFLTWEMWSPASFMWFFVGRASRRSCPALT